MKQKKSSAVILTKNRPYHWYFISELSEILDIKLIIIEKNKRSPFFKKLKKHGLGWTALKLLSKLTNNFVKKIDIEFSNKFKDFDENKTKRKYEQIIIKTDDINSKDIKNKLNSTKPKYLCSLGGGILDNSGISSSSLALNYHSGISPFYNGADSPEKVFESRNLNFFGGTLMVMTEEIDAGPILAHFLPEINEKDNPESLYIKNILGGIFLFKDFILFNEKENTNLSLLQKQKKSLHYYLGYDKTIFTDLVVNYFFKKKLVKKYTRNEKYFKYYEKKLDFNELLKLLNVIS